MFIVFEALLHILNKQWKKALSTSRSFQIHQIFHSKWQRNKPEMMQNLMWCHAAATYGVTLRWYDEQILKTTATIYINKMKSKSVQTCFLKVFEGNFRACCGPCRDFSTVDTQTEATTQLQLLFNIMLLSALTEKRLITDSASLNGRIHFFLCWIMKMPTCLYIKALPAVFLEKCHLR